MIVLALTFMAVAVLVSGGLIALGIELNRRDYSARRAAQLGGAVVSFASEGENEERRAA
jgi:pantothenate kinase type III